MDGEAFDREVVRLAVGAAGAIGNDRRAWLRRIAELTTEIGAMFRPVPESHRDTASTPLVTARKMRESASFLRTFVRYEEEANTHRMVVFFEADNQTNADEKEGDGTESMRTEPAWTRAGTVTQAMVKELVPGQECMVYKYVEPIDGGRKKVRVLVHLEPRRKPKNAGQQQAAPPRQAAASQSAPADGGTASSPPAPSQPDPRGEVAGENEAITTRFNALTPQQRVAFGRACSGYQIANFMDPAVEDVDKVLVIIGKIERSEPPTL